MQDSDPNYTTVDKFNDDVKKWTSSTKRGVKSNVQSKIKGVLENKKGWKGRKSKNLAKSLRSGFRKHYDQIYRIRFGFERHGVYLHYGVGRGYTREGGAVYRYASKGGPFKRHPIDWFDSEIKKRIPDLANVAQEYFADKSVLGTMGEYKNALIEKK